MPTSITKHIERRLAEKSALHKESAAKWQKDKPLREPGTSLATWKTYSQQKFASEAYRHGYDQISWGS